MSRNTGTFNFAANFEVLAKAPLDAKQLVGTKADLTGTTTWNQSGQVWLYDGAIVAVGSDPVAENNGVYWLSASTNYTNINSWVKVGNDTGTGKITGGTNGLSTAGANVVLGGNLTGNTTISGGGLYNVVFDNINNFQITPSGSSNIVFGVDETGLLYSFTGGSITYDDNGGLKYAGDYSLNYSNRSLVDKAYVDAIAAGLQPKMAADVATTANISLSGNPTIDGIIVQNGWRVLVKNQTTGWQNGIYVVTGGTWSRSTDFDFTPSGEVAQGALVPVITGNTNRNSIWVLVTPDPISSGQTLTFTLFSSPLVSAGVGITVSGTTISVDGASLAGNSIAWTGNTFNVDIGSGTLATALSDINNDITYISGQTNLRLTISDFNAYTGATETRLQGIENDIIYLSGVIDNKLDVSVFTGYTATTDTRFDNIESDIQYISGQTDLRLTISDFNAYTGATETRLNTIESDITGLTATTAALTADIQYISGQTDLRLTISDFNAYTGTTQPILNAALTGATNGLSISGRNVKLGGALCQTTTISGNSQILCLGTSSSCLNLFDVESSQSQIQSSSICLNGTTCTQINGGNINICLTNTCGLITDNRAGGNRCGLEYAANYSADYTIRSLPDVAYVTGYTQSAITNSSNVLNVVDFTGATYSAATTSDFIGASGGTVVYLPVTPKFGQRIVVSDIAGNALSNNIIVCSTIPAQHIVGSSCATINTDYGSITFIYNTKCFWSTAAFIN